MVNSFPFNLECLHMWNWGEVVHSYLVKALDRASYLFRYQTNTGGLHLCGCVPVLQVCVKLCIMWCQFGNEICDLFIGLNLFL